MPANDEQIGGEHYRASYQHWDFITINRLGYLEGCATKYITRWRKKNGAQDLRKATHYLQKLREVATEGRVAPPKNVSSIQVMRFSVANELTDQESILIARIASWEHADDLLEAERELSDLLTEATKEERDG